MTSSLNIAPLIPHLVPVWIGAAVVSVAQLAMAERQGGLPDRPVLCTALQFLDLGSFFTMFILAGRAHSNGLIPMWLFILVVVLTKWIFHLVWKASPCTCHDACK